MSDEASTPRLTDGPFIIPIKPDGPFQSANATVGGKARSLARLAALGLPTPRAFAISDSLWNALRASGPPLPDQLDTAANLLALDTARDTLLGSPFPVTFDHALQTALDGVQPSHPLPPGQPITYAVRSSGDTEDHEGALGAGIYASLLRVPRAGVPGAIRQVLASFLTPAAWAYSASSRAPARGGAGSRAGGAVLIHDFVDGDAAGAAAAGETAAVDAIRIDATHGRLTNTAREKIVTAVRATVEAYGPSEIEWVAEGDKVTFLQMRGYRPVSNAATARRAATANVGPATKAFAAAMDANQPGGPWTWDAAHNPLPLSAAQAGLVQLCDARCQLGFRQRVIQGYLFFREAPAPSAPPQSRVDAREAFQELRASVIPRLEALGPEPFLADALELFVSAYEPLFGAIGSACVVARRALTDFLRRRLPERVAEQSTLPAPLLATLLAGVPSVAQRRRTAVDAIKAAATAQDRLAAMEAYLNEFADESARWDVAEPTLRETPQRLLLLTAGSSTRSPSTGHDHAAIAGARATSAAHQVRSLLAVQEQFEFDRLLASARAAVSVGEDDDALFARLQAGVRRALLALARRLVAAGALNDASDVFDLPLSVSRTLDGDGDGRDAATFQKDQRPVTGVAGAELKRLAAAGRQSFREATAASPAAAIGLGAKMVRGMAGASGKVVGRAVHHPPSVPMGADAILIASTLLPTELPLLSPAAIVVETGHALGHVAAQARERGFPAVVGATGAMTAIPEDALIVVDGDRGEVIRLCGPD